ncbi:AmmeMemoRadiSam system radical SAM enzyme [bacterium]|nr:AmmeMemoRadiSam system radical SAM enzyme [bacterium]
MNVLNEHYSSRRRFLGNTATLAASLLLPRNGHAADLSSQPARYWRALEGQAVECLLCPWQCIVQKGYRGRCQVRENVDGRYISLIYGRIASIHTDPIEKKPFYHFLPGSEVFSMATAGCNVDCSFCQNWTLARRKPEELPNVGYKPEQIVSTVRQKNVPVIAYTYNEPTIYNEFIFDTSMLAKDAGIHTVIVSNGFINKKPLKDLCQYIDAYKVDLKAFTEDYYTNVVHGRLRPVLDSLVVLKEEDVWTEIVYLVVPTLNDKPEEIRDMTRWIIKNLGDDIPLHFSRFTPKYRLRHLPPTPVKTLENLRNVAMDAGLKYVYLGNVPGHEGANSYCPSCNKLLIRRVGYRIYENNISNGLCGSCNTAIPGIWRPKRRMQ